jgi:hypothetical protein
MNIRTVFIALTTTLLMSIVVTVGCFGQELPQVGTVIDKSNYKKYAHLFPAEYLPALEDGFGGLIKPATLKVTAGSPHPLSQEFLALSAVNKGKYSLDKDGNILGGWMRQGLPFPDINKNDKDWITKVMWNFSARYVGDEEKNHTFTWTQRRGEDIRFTEVEVHWLFFTNRLVTPPKPLMENPTGAARIMLLNFLFPPSMKNTLQTAIRYMDPTKGDETYMYLPSMRRVLRADSAQRSTPVQGLFSALDDFDGCDVRTPDFSYKLVAEQKIMAESDAPPVGKAFENTLKKEGKITNPVSTAAARDVYVIDLIPKDPKYPQSKKRIWIDKENYVVYWAVAWDKGGKPWKIWNFGHNPYGAKSESFVHVANSLSADIQFGMVACGSWDYKLNMGGMKWEEYSPQSMVRRAKQ